MKSAYDITMHINLLLLKLRGSVAPSFFDDSAEAAALLLRQCGVSAVVSTNRIATDALNIVWGAGTHLAPDLQLLRQVLPPERTLIFNMEQVASGSPLIHDGYLDFLSHYRVLDYSQHNLEALCARRPDLRGVEFPLLPGANLADWGDEPEGPPCDIAFFGALNLRREQVLTELAAMGLRVLKIQGRFGPRLSAALTGARLVLNVHAYDSAVFEIARVLRPMAMGIPIVSEISNLPSSLDWTRSGIVWASASNISERCSELLSEPETLMRQSRRQLAFLGSLESARTALRQNMARHDIELP